MVPAHVIRASKIGRKDTNVLKYPKVLISKAKSAYIYGISQLSLPTSFLPKALHLSQIDGPWGRFIPLTAVLCPLSETYNPLKGSSTLRSFSFWANVLQSLISIIFFLAHSTEKVPSSDFFWILWRYTVYCLSSVNFGPSDYCLTYFFC